MNRLSFLLMLLGAFASLAIAASAPTFCKCTCFTNSTIIEIKSKSSSSGSSHFKEPSDPSVPSDDDDVPSSTPSSDAATAEPTSPLPASSPQNSLFTKRAQASPTCTQCNRAFCLSQSLPICKGAGEKDVVTMCFQRDSRKDQIIVWGFILGTAGLLGWAAVRKALEAREGPGGFAGILGGGGGGSSGRGDRRGGRGGGGVGRGNVGALPVGSRFAGATGSDAGRGAYVGVSGHSRDGSGLS